MKISICKRILTVLTAVILLLSLTSCKTRGDTVSVTIIDGTVSVTVEGRDVMTVQQFLNQADISVTSKDKVTPDRNTVWKDAGAENITIERCVTVTVTDGNTTKSVTLAGATVDQAITEAGFESSRFNSDVDKAAHLTDGMVITLTEVLNGFGTDGDNLYYFVNGEMLKESIVGSEAEGYYYANADGVIDTGYCDALNINGTDWNIINGQATSVVTEADKTLHSALKAVAQCTDSSMTKDEKLQALFNYIKTSYLEGVLHDPPYREEDWPIVCANDLFVYGKGDCYSYGAAFAFMAKAIGCTDVYACNSGGHGWAEAEGKVYDPEWSMHSDKYTYFAVTPDQEVDVRYWSSIADGAEWKRKAI